jgi:hypothetical protein
MDSRIRVPALLAMLFMGACTGADDAVEGAAPSDDVLPREAAAQDMVAIESALLDHDRDTFNAAAGTATLPQPLDTLLATWGARPPASCVHASAWIDEDKDGIPARWKAGFDCLIRRADGLLVRIDGRVGVADNDDHIAMSGFRMEFDGLHVALFEQRSLVLGRTLYGSASVEAVGPRALPAAKLVLGHDLKLTLESGQPGFIGIYKSHLAGTYVPDTDVVREAPLARGTLDFDENATLTLDGEGKIPILRKSAPTLHYNALCKARDPQTPPFDGGTYLIVIGRQILRVHFTSCGDWTLAGVGVTGADETLREPDVTPGVPALAQPRAKPTNTGDPPQVPPPLE